MSALYNEYDPQTLAQIQRVLLGMLDDFIALCDKHDIRRWNEFRMTLGALRHGRIIPWDDDIDLGMLQEDFEACQKRRFGEYMNLALPDCCHNHLPWKLDFGPWGGK